MSRTAPISSGFDVPSGVGRRDARDLPPGVTLAAPVKNVREVQGALALRVALDASPLPMTLELPVRFALSGKVTVPEARARVAFEDAPRSIAPVRGIAIE